METEYDVGSNMLNGDPQPDPLSEELRVLVVDDRQDTATLTAKGLEEYVATIRVITETDACDGLDRLYEEEIDAIVSDYDMPGMDGLEFLKEIRDEFPQLPFILFTGKGSEDVASEAISAGVTEYFQKQHDFSQYELLANRIEKAIASARAHKALTEQEAWYRGLIQASADIFAVLASDGIFEYLSPAVTDILGYEPDDLVGENTFEFIHPADRENARTQFDALRDESPDVELVEFRFRQANGEWRWLEARAINRLDDLIIEGIVVSARDISDRKARERELERYETIVDTAGDGIYSLDAEGHFTMVNDNIVERTGYSRADLLGEHVSVLLPEEDIERGAQRIGDLLSDPEKEVASYEARAKTADGGTIPVELRIALLPAEDDEFRGTVGIARDLSERKRRERELQRQNERLEEFASVVSHDLRNPLAVAQGNLEMATRTGEYNEYLDEVKQAHAEMGQLIEDLLNLAQQGRIVQDFEPVALATVAHDAWTVVTANDSPHELAVTTDDAVVLADPDRLRQVFENFFRNSIEHVGPNVSVRVGLLDDQRGFYVEDNGPGITVDDRKKVFERGFSTSDTGTGFGLAIVKQIIDAHGWALTATEGADGGARFEITGVEWA